MSRTKKILKWLHYKFRIVVMSSQSFEERKKWNFNRFGFISMLLGFAVLIIAITSICIAYTPLREFIPGYPDKMTKKAIVENAIRLDSLEQEILVRDQYLTNLKQVLFGERPFNPELELHNGAADSVRKQVTASDISPSLIKPLGLENAELISFPADITIPEVFFPPAKGVVTNSFDPSHGHFGTDIVTPNDEIVRASLDGTVILANWTIETGYTIQIQHNNNYITVYRHLKKLLHKAGDKVKAGESIGVYGDTGEISFGPHLHFEIWHNGAALDPEKLIEF